MSVNIQKIGVIGAGQMGSGIAHVCAQHGFDVFMLDMTDDALASGMSRIEKGMGRLVSREKMSADEMTTAMARIATGTDYASFGDCDMIIEAASEDEDVKKAILKLLCPVIKDEAIVASQLRAYGERAPRRARVPPRNDRKNAASRGGSSRRRASA